MKQKILFNLFFKIYAKKTSVFLKTYIFVQKGSNFSNPTDYFSEHIRQNLAAANPLFKYFLKTRGGGRYFFGNSKNCKAYLSIWRTKSKSGARASTT